MAKRQLLIGNFLKLTSVYFLGALSEKALSLFLLPLYAHLLSSAEFGSIALLALTTSLLTKPVIGPLNCALIRYYHSPEYTDNKDELLFNTFLLLVVKIGVVYFLFWEFKASICCFLLGSLEHITLVTAYGLLLILTPITSFMMTLFKLEEKAWLCVFLSLGRLCLSGGVIIVLMIWYNWGIYAPVYGQIVGLLFVLLCSLPVFVHYLRFSITPSCLTEPLIYAYPLIPSSFSNLLIQSGDRYLLMLLGSVELVGIYSFGYRIASGVNILLVTPVKQSMWPIVLKLEGKSDRQKRFLRDVSVYFYSLGVFVTLVISMFAKEIVTLLAQGSEFCKSWQIVCVISFCYILHGLGNFLGWGMIMKKKSYHVSGILLFSAALNLGLNVILIPPYGAMGAAIATLASYIVWDLLKAYYSAFFYNLTFDWKKIIKVTLIGGFLISVGLTLNLRAQWMSFMAKAGWCLFYIPLLWLSGVFGDAESNFVLSQFKKTNMI